MPQILLFDDYRDFLREACEERRKVASYFSYRFIGNRVGMDSSYLTKLFQKKVHVVEDQIPRLAKVFGLDDHESDYLEALVAFNKARTASQAKTLYETLVRLRGVGYVSLAADRRAFFSSWHAVALRNLLDCGDVPGDPAELGRRLSPPIGADEVVADLELLERLGLVVRDDGKWRVVDAHLHSGSDHGSFEVRAFQTGTMELALRSLREDPPEIREFGTMTMNIGPAQLSDLRVLVKDFFENVARLVDDGSPSDRVYQMNLQLFPLTAIEGPSDRKGETE